MSPLLAVALALGCTTCGGAGGLDGSGGARPGGSGGHQTSGAGGATGLGGGSASVGSGGVPGNGGASLGSGGVPGSGGVKGSGGVSAGAGASGNGGRASPGGRAGTGSGGAPGIGGAGGTDGAAGACKRGIASNTPPTAGLRPGVGWWYDWSNQGNPGSSGVEFVPMMWGSSSLTSAIPQASKFLLTFNEPNFHAQSNLTAAQAAGLWPQVQAKAAGLPIVGPGMNFCGPESACNGTSPYQYLKDFFAACTDCRVDHVAVHWYNCDLPSLKDYLEPGGNLEGFEQFGKPIWLTEFSCDPSASKAEQEAYLRAAVPYLEANPHVFRYAWFSASNIPNAQLLNSDGTLTALGQVYATLPGSCTP